MADDYSFVGDTSVPHREAAIPAAAKTKNPVRQALVSSTGTFWDTVVICGESVQGSLPCHRLSRHCRQSGSRLESCRHFQCPDGNTEPHLARPVERSHSQGNA